MSFLTPVWNYVDALVHPAAQQDALTAARHRAFMAPRLLGSFAALAGYPIYLALRGMPSALEIGVFAWLALPILIAFYLARSGDYIRAHLFSSLSLAGLIVAVAWQTGGIASFAAIWLVVVPLEASLSASRRLVALASMLALAAAGLLYAATAFGHVPPPALSAASEGALAAFAVVSASLYATALAFGAEALARTSLQLLSAGEDRYRLLARNMSDVIVRHDRDGGVLFASPAAERLFAAPVDDIAGHGLFARVHVADRPAYLKALADAAALNEPQSVEFRVRRGERDGFVWIEMRCHRLQGAPADAAGNTGEVVAVLRDVSERKRQEHAVEAARAESDRANAAKSHFLATMSHELRTPLNAIIGFSDMLANESLALDPARRAEYGRLINQSGRHLLSVLNGILDMSKMESGNFEIVPEPFAPAEVIVSCCDLLALKARESGVTIARRIAEGLPDIVADRKALSQILINLVSNAIKFTPRGGTVTVGVAAGASRLAIVVEDTGVGIGEDDLPRLGEAFFQARTSYDRRHDGTGLGLSIVKGLVRLHGGTLDIASRLGEGTRVTVRLPLDCQAARPPEAVVLMPRGNKRSDLEPVQVRKSA